MGGLWNIWAVWRYTKIPPIRPAEQFFSGRIRYRPAVVLVNGDSPSQVTWVFLAAATRDGSIARAVPYHLDRTPSLGKPTVKLLGFLVWRTIGYRHGESYV